MSNQFRELDTLIVQHSTIAKIDTPTKAAGFLQRLFGDSMQEHFAVILLDGRQRPTGFAVVSKGTQTASLVHPREVFMPALRDGAVSIIVGHNHPSGDPSPSAEDRTITKRLARAGELLGVKLLDHVIVASDGIYSFADKNPDFLDGTGVAS